MASDAKAVLGDALDAFLLGNVTFHYF
jgi:hypothetical protein